MPVFFFHSEMVGAPENTNAAGSTLGILEACLVNGFNAKSVVSATVSAEVMTLVYATPHGYDDAVWLRLDGAPGGSLVQRCSTAPGASTLTIAAPGFPDGSVSGSISTRVAPADWERPFFDANKAVFRSKVEGPGSTRFYYRVSDAVAGEQVDMFRGFVAMTDVDTGDEPFPTTATWPGNGSAVTRANQASALPWVLIADGRSVYLFCAYYTYANFFAHFFGDLTPFSSTDTYFAGMFLWNASIGYGPSGENGGVYAPREHNGAPGAVSLSMIQGLGAYSGTRTFPSPVDGGVVMQRPVMMITSDASAFRGAMRGLMHLGANPIPATKGWEIFPSVSGVQGRVLVVRDRGDTRCVAFPLDEEWA